MSLCLSQWDLSKYKGNLEVISLNTNLLVLAFLLPLSSSWNLDMKATKLLPCIWGQTMEEQQDGRSLGSLMIQWSKERELISNHDLLYTKFNFNQRLGSIQSLWHEWNGMIHHKSLLPWTGWLSRLGIALCTKKLHVHVPWLWLNPQ